MTLPVPPVTWAQRPNLVYLTVCLEDCSNPEIKIENEKLFFKGNGGTSKKDHELTLNFYGKIKPEDSKYIVRGRGTEFVLYKETDEWWPRLLSENKKYHWLKVDFNKWRDEDDSEGEADGPEGFDPNSYDDMMRQLGGNGLGAGNGLGDFNIDSANFGDEKEEDDAEEDLPELDEVAETAK